MCITRLYTQIKNVMHSVTNCSSQNNGSINSVFLHIKASLIHFELIFNEFMNRQCMPTEYEMVLFNVKYS